MAPGREASAARAERIGRIAAVAKLALGMVALTSYGYFRDELYYLVCARHLAFGYVDHPPFSIAFLAAWAAVFGSSIASIRVVPAVCGALVVYLTARLTAKSGGGPLAVLLASTTVMLAPALAATDHYYSMNALDHLFWVAATYVARDALSARSARAWIVLGVVLGLGLLNKLSVLWLGAGLAVGIVALAEGRAALRTKGPWISAALAMLLFLPHAIWQVKNGFPTAEFAKNALAVKYVRLSLGAFLRELVLPMNVGSVPLVIAALVAAVRPQGARLRLPVIVFVVAFAIVASSKAAKPEYLYAAYPLVVAAGATALEGALARIGATLRRALVAAWALVTVGWFAALLPIALPILGETSFIAYQRRLGIEPHKNENKSLGELPQHFADMHGWDELVRAARDAYATIPEAERSHAKVWAVTGGYGSAAAIEILAPDLPRPISTSNNYWLWGYGDDTAGPVVLLGGSEASLSREFASLERTTMVECGYCMPYENHKPVWIGRNMRRSWAELWRDRKHFE